MHRKIGIFIYFVTFTSNHVCVCLSVWIRSAGMVGLQPFTYPSRYASYLGTKVGPGSHTARIWEGGGGIPLLSSIYSPNVLG